ncbi:helix-turn-helix transcriptional regulator [Nocardia veterana]|uniref:Helix-turn-helix transcriptional regulator n=2 Tax=Nocardia veterana TaxID=132249 RepID=A0A7X6RK38_9NOCA|nr:helix-turn-helix transcriptional regulator [Nocardia veterana]
MYTAERDLTGAAIAKHLGFSPTYWSKFERDRKILSEDKLQLLFGVLDLSADDREDLLALRAAASGRGWWAEYSNLFGVEHQRLWGLEFGASEISAYESLLIPGLLQTESYARALIDQDDVFIPKKEVARRVEVRMRRQERLTGADPLRFNAIVSQAALLQQVGGPDVLREQLQHLAHLIRRYPETLDVRVMPFTSRSGYLFGGAAFYVIEFDRPFLPPLGWHESTAVSGVIENSDQVRDLTIAFEAAQRNALGKRDTLALIEESAGRLGTT